MVLHTGYPEGDLMNRALKGAPFTVLTKPAPAEQMLNTVRLLARWNPETARERKANRLPGSNSHYAPGQPPPGEGTRPTPPQIRPLVGRVPSPGGPIGSIMRIAGCQDVKA